MVFALDIGTRVVVGVVLERAVNKWRVRAAAVEEHAQRAMLDGQIHDIPAVGAVVGRIKEKLESKLQTQLREVAVAAAGRALYTQRAKASQRPGQAQEITREVVLALELEAVQDSLRLLAKRFPGFNEYHCVGYSVLGYWLDGATIGNLVGHRGNTIEVEVVATFLPRVVVDSLYAVVEQAGLVVQSLTLEPIAVGTLVIKPGMRQLNLALVDIGAGTSDIAVARGGSLVAYGMVPVAGDEVTEHLCHQLLVDYGEGERVKRRLRRNGEITFRDVVGQEQRVAAADIVALIKPVVSDISRQVAEVILELNGGAPQAVLCVGGGSLTPGLPEELAACLGLPAQRVAVRGLEAVPEIVGKIRGIEPVQAITPLGIAVAWQNNEMLNFAQVMVNRRPVRLLKGGNASVADALLAAGIGMRELYGSLGRGLTVEVNGEFRLVRGTLGRPAPITVNGRLASLEMPVGYGDVIEVGVPEPGAEARVTIGEVLPPLAPKTISFQGRQVVLEPYITMNEVPVGLDEPLLDNAKIYYHNVDTVEAVLDRIKRPLLPGETVMVNGQVVDRLWPVQDGDSIVIVENTAEDGAPLQEAIVGVTFNRRELTIPVSGGVQPIVSDVFRYAEAPKAPPGGQTSLVVEINGEKASFTDHIKDGDVITVGWK